MVWQATPYELTGLGYRVSWSDMNETPPILDYATQPPGCTAICEQRPGFVSFTELPRGFWGRETKGIIAFLIITIILSLVAIDGLRKIAYQFEYEWGVIFRYYWHFVLGTMAALLVTWPSVIVLLVSRANKGKLPTILHLDEVQLVLISPGVRGQVRQAWPRERIRAFQAWSGVDRDMKLRPLGCLRVHFSDRRPLTVFASHPVVELEWMVRILRQSLEQAPTKERRP